MQSDEVIWSIIDRQFCSYKVKLDTGKKFCRNKYNVTGECRRDACPLANSQYATVIEEEGILYLYTKTIERIHTPAKMWHRLKLSKNYAKAMEQVHTTLRYWPSFLRNKCKQRLTKMAQYLVRARNLAKKTEKVKLIPVSRKVERRLRSREAKALNAAKLENTIEKELLQRLQSGTYGDIYNFNQSAFTSALDQQTVEDEIEDELEEEEAELELEDDADFEAVYSSDDEDYSSGSDDDTLYEQEEEDEEDLEGEWVENGPDGSDDEDDLEEFPLNDSWGASDDEEAPAAPAPGSKKRSAGSQKSGGPAAKRRVHGAGGSFLEIEYEKEDETPAQLASN